MHLTFQLASASPHIPAADLLKAWAEAAHPSAPAKTEVVLRIVAAAESARLNQTYRHKPGPTNVLSFPFEAPPGVPVEILGDIIICAELVEREASEQGKSLMAHWAHLVVHGLLHLQGYDHQTEAEAWVMEQKEIAILDTLGFSNPYEEVLRHE
ncbi:MAG: rRNA maturation RNase YbeY [Methylococcaceae bacterium]